MPRIRAMDYKLDVFTRVCVYWRQTAIDAAGLWTQVVVGPDISPNLTNLLLDWSKDLPVTVHMFEPKFHGGPTEPDVYASENAAYDVVLGSLKQHLHRICALRIWSNSHQGRFICTLLELWSNCGGIDRLRFLSIHRNMHSDFLPLCTQIKEAEKLEELLLGLNTLHLFRIKLDWDSSAYHRLVDLRISVDCIEMSKSQFANILRTSPALTILKLELVDICTDEGGIQLAPIVMMCLKVVNLSNMEPHQATRALSLITLPGPQVELSITLTIESV
ncbi:hypothetical protein FRC07_009518, partial [Ceratobasidium sp. 392]